MNTPRKLKAGKDSELTRLKELWPGLPADVRTEWLETFASSEASQEKIRARILAELQVNLERDNQVTRFRRFAVDAERREEAEERMEENERRIKTDHPDWSAEQVREEVIKAAYFETLASGDFYLGLDTVRQDLNVKRVAMDREKLELFKHKAKPADSAKEVVKSKMTPAQKEAEYRRIFGML